jgi:hypothetical protein
MSRVRFLQIFWMMHVGNDTTEESNRAIKITKKYFSLHAFLAPNFRAKQLIQWLCGDLKSP